MRIRTSNSPTAISQLNVYPERARNSAKAGDSTTPALTNSDTNKNPSDSQPKNSDTTSAKPEVEKK
jgi:hypothetical protein